MNERTQIDQRIPLSLDTLKGVRMGYVIALNLLFQGEKKKDELRWMSVLKWSQLCPHSSSELNGKS